MRWWLLLAAVAMLVACTPAPDLSPLETTGGAIVATEIWGKPPLDPDHGKWETAAPAEVVVYPQNSVTPVTSDNPIGRAEVRALHNGEIVALRLEWEDSTPAEERGIGRFADAAALQWPLRRDTGPALPYIGMGQPDDPVAVWLWRASGKAETLAAEGFGTLTARPDDGLRVQASRQDGKWRVVFQRRLGNDGESGVTLPLSDEQGLVPVALAVWNGENGERNGMKRLSAWRVLYLEGRGAGPEAIGRLADRPGAGDPRRGAALMSEKGCAACHAYPDNPAQPDIGPNLRYAGGIHRANYLRQSITEPAAIIVPGEGHSMTRDGERISTMPPVDVPEQALEDLVAYLQTLRQ